MVGAGRERSEAPTSARGGRGSSIPPQSLRRALHLGMQTPPAVASSSAGRGRGGRRRRRLVEVDVAAGEARHNKAPVPELFDLYAMSNTASYKKAKSFSESDLDDPEKFSNRASHHKLVRYRDEGKARKGPDFNPSQQPLDPELVMISGGGRHHGSLAIGDGLIRCTSTLPQIKKRQTSSDPEIRPRARPMELEFQAAIEKERAKTEELLAEREREMEDRTAKLLEEERNRNDAQNRALYELFVTMCQGNGQTPPPMPVIASADTHNSRQASTDPSPSATGATGPTPTHTPP